MRSSDWTGLHQAASDESADQTVTLGGLMNSTAGKQSDPQLQLHPATHAIGPYRRSLSDQTEEHC